MKESMNDPHTKAILTIGGEAFSRPSYDLGVEAERKRIIKRLRKMGDKCMERSERNYDYHRAQELEAAAMAHYFAADEIEAPDD